MHLTLRRLFATTLLSVPLLTLATSARAADPTKQECIDANEKSGPLRQAGKLREARASLLRCSAASCPGVVRDDCIAGATRLEQAVPTIVFVAQDASGTEISAVKVTMDGQPFAEKLDGAAIEADSGEHVFGFATATGTTVEKRLILHEGEKNRRELVALGGTGAAPPAPSTTTPGTTAPPATPEPATAGTWTGQKKIALVVAGVGVVGLGVGAVFGLLAHNNWEQAKTDCGASCGVTSTAQSEADSAHSQATISNVLFGVGAAAVVTGAVLWLLAPSGGSTATARVTPLLGPNVAGLAASGSLP
jgi:hypothetical protein